MKQVTEAELFSRLRDLIKTKTYRIPDYPGFGGTGGPGLMLEEILGFDPNNRDGPDSGTWEIKFHSGRSPLTLFHKTPEPDGVMHSVVRTCGWPDKLGRTSFRHTIWGKSPRGFQVVDEASRLIVRNEKYPDIIPPYWAHDTLINAFVYKLRRLVVVHGSVSKKHGTVNYESAQMHWEPRITSLISEIQSGTIAIDFDARTTDGHALRDHGTKFRISINDLDRLYKKTKKFA